MLLGIMGQTFWADNKYSLKLSPFKIVLIYAVIGGLWILFSDSLLAARVVDPAIITKFSIYKGWAYVLVTALLLYWLIGRYASDIKIAEMALQKNEELLRLFVEHAPAAIAMFDRDMKYIAASRRFLMDYGLGDQGIIGRSHYELFPEIPERWREIHRRCLKGAVEKSEEDPFQRADGKVDWVRWEIRPWHEAQGEIGGIILFSEVITERKKVDQELKEHREHLEELVQERTAELKDSQTALMNMVEDLNQKTEELGISNERLKELDRLKSIFIASMSHELRTPLNSIIGFTGIILQGMAGGINEEQRDQLQRVSRAGKHLLALITDVIDISKIEAGKIEAYAEEFQIESVLNEAVSNLKLQIREKGLELEVNIIPKKIILKTDRKRLLQCVLNLLSNAVKFTEKGKIAIVAEDKGDIMQLSVTDTGIGIKEEDLPMLFNSFVRLDSPLKMSVSGTGLGLYLTKKLVTEVLGGEVVATSNYGKGSTFMLSIPKNLRGHRDEAHL